ncbi:MAG: serine/threonine protein kinase [Gemmatimonadaceae bacterium]|nr:serine/threonine protein kinase [Gemmatimonadaceae bacterium]
MIPNPDIAEFDRRLKETLSTAYEIDRELGGGGMSRVFVATDRILGRKIVIKVLSPELTAEVNRGRFRREMQVAAQLQHPHIVPLLSAGEQDDLLYFTMPFIKGESLKTAVEKDGGMSVAEVVRVLYHVGEALDYAHEAGVVHRDIKPANVLRSGSYALITDFGVAKALNAAMSAQVMTSTGMAIGTPMYMAPEQLAGDSAADHRVDIYAAGLLAYELLHGKSPYAAATPQRVLAAVLTQDPRPLIEVEPKVPQALSDLIMRCLAKEPEHRPATAKELLKGLDVFLDDSGRAGTIERRVAHIAHTPTPTPAVTPVVIRDLIPTPRSTRTVEVQAAEVQAVEVHAVEVQADEADELLAHEIQGVGSASLFGEKNYDGYQTPKKSRAGLLAGVVTVFALIAAGGFLWLQPGGDGAPITVAADPGAAVSLISDSGSVQVPVATVPESTAIVLVDSQAIRDSIRRVARAKAAKEAAAKEAAAKDDSLKKAEIVEASTLTRARAAAGAMLSDESARKAFAKGASHKGGVLGTRKSGDLQTQIDALQPFLSQARMSYEHFKLLVQGAGVDLFDKEGRMIPDALQRFASGS